MSNDEKPPQPPVPPSTTLPAVEPAKDISEVVHTPDVVPETTAPVKDISLDEALSADAKKKKDKPKSDKATKQIMYGAGGVFLLILIMMIYSCQPRHGSMAYGICSTFLELNTPYPQTLSYKDLDLSRTAVRIYFTNIDPFGEFKLETIECTFGADEKMGFRLVKVKRNRIDVDPQIVKKFNLTLPTIMASNPYLLMPPDWKNQLLPDEQPMYMTQPLPNFFANPE